MLSFSKRQTHEGLVANIGPTRYSHPGAGRSRRGTAEAKAAPSSIEATGEAR